MQRSRTYRPGDAPRARFFASRYWLVLRNVLGWGLIVLSLAAGPLIPGPGGIPLFLIGFALVTLPGKRHFTARVLRGRRIAFRTKMFARITLAVAVAASVATLTSAQPWTAWRIEPAWARVLVVVLMYACGSAAAWLVIRLTLRLTNAVLGAVPRIRRRLRPWLRRHGVQLLPPRQSRPAPGHKSHRFTDEILKLGKRA